MYSRNILNPPLWLPVVLAVLAGASSLSACGGGDGNGSSFTNAPPASPASPALPGAGDTASASLTAEEAVGMRYMREEEKLAHDVYVTLAAAWGLPVFSNIAASETQHMDAMLRLLERYGLADPAAGKGIGEFADTTLQGLHDRLVAAGRTSVIEALKVGALIEETDLHDIELQRSKTDNADILQVYDSLLCGSGNHLRAFNQQLLARGVTYTPQVISQAEWDDVASAAASSCG